MGGRSADGVRETSFELTTRDERRYELIQELVLSGITPSELALALRAWTYSTWSYPSRVRVEGEHAPSNDADSVTTERARSWFADGAIDPIALPELPYTIDDAGDPDLLVRVTHASGAGEKIRDTLVELNPLLPPPTPEVRPDPFGRGLQLAITPGKVRARQTTLRAHLVGDPTQPPRFDRRAARTLVLTALASCPGVEHVTWCLRSAD